MVVIGIGVILLLAVVAVLRQRSALSSSPAGRVPKDHGFLEVLIVCVVLFAIVGGALWFAR